jgi:S-adenosylmethionine synthetase
LRNISVEALNNTPVGKSQVEIVERKGVGHPDSICDSIMERVSVELSREYIKRFGGVLHHNIDKGLLVAGQSEKKFGGGRILEPIKLIFGDRATFEFDGEEIPVNDIAKKAAKKWFRENLRYVNAEKNVSYQFEIKQGSAELTDIFKRKGKVLGAGDTSAAVGYAPLTETEKTVLKTERYLNSKEFNKRFPASGEDIKVMGCRTKGDLHLTVAMAFVDRFVENEKSYFRQKEEMFDDLNGFLSKNSGALSSKVYLNTLDERGRGLGGVYLTVTGTSAEDADSGAVGRGNRVNGVIALNRPMGTEAAAGKNPVSHVGKIYNLLSHKIASDIHSDVSGVDEVYVWLCSQIGHRIDEPKVAAAQLILSPNTNIRDVKGEVAEIMDSELEHINDFCKQLIQGKIPIC